MFEQPTKPVLAKLLAICAASLFVLTTIGARPAAASPIYNGGPVISSTPDVYFIWYGSWGNNSALTLLPSFVSGLSGTSYLGTETTMAGDGLVNYRGSTFISSTTNSSLYFGGLRNPFSQIQSIVLGALSNGLLPRDPNGIYDVLTAPGLNVKGFNTQFCGYHDSTNWGGNSLGVQFAFIGDPTSRQTGCYAQSNSPNGNFGADAMASVIAHELIETVTDPTGTAWFDSFNGSSTNGYEDADMCAWNFGSVYRTANGSSANYSSGGKNYLLQQEWVNKGGGLGFSGGNCAMSTSGTTTTTSFTSSAGPFAAVAPLPEPLTLSVFGAGLAGAFALRRRRKADKTS